MNGFTVESVFEKVVELQPVRPGGGRPHPYRSAFLEHVSAPPSPLPPAVSGSTALLQHVCCGVTQPKQGVEAMEPEAMDCNHRNHVTTSILLLSELSPTSICHRDGTLLSKMNVYYCIWWEGRRKPRNLTSLESTPNHKPFRKILTAPQRPAFLWFGDLTFRHLTKYLSLTQCAHGQRDMRKWTRTHCFGRGVI